MGTNAAEGLQFYNNDQDGDYKFYGGASNTLLMTIDTSAGNVGIGEASPTAKLHVKGPSTRGTGTGIALERTGGSDFACDLYETSAGSGVLQLRDAAADNVLINSNGTSYLNGGTVSINNASPDTNHRFFITGTATTSAKSTMMCEDSAGTDYFRLRDDGVCFTNDGTVTSIASDARLKTNLQPITDALSTLLALNPTKFDWKVPEAHKKPSQVGFIAQEVQKIKPDWVIKGNLDKREYEHIPEEEKDSVLTVQLGDLNPYLIKAIQEQQAMIDGLRKDIEILKAG